MIDLRLSLDKRRLESGEHRRLLFQLSQRLRRVDLLSIELEQEAAAASGAKGFAEAGALALQILPALLPKLVEAIAAWVGKRPERTVSLRLVSGGHQVELTFAPQSMSPEKISEYIRSIEAASGLNTLEQP